MVTLESVSKAYPGRRPILEGVHLKLKRGQFLYVLGGSGAGKSSLLKMLATQEGPSAGVISLLGYPLNELSPATLRTVRRSIGYIPQDHAIIPDLTVLENILIPAQLARRESEQVLQEVQELLGRTGLHHRQNDEAGELSEGEKQRVAVVRALARKPELILADEPTGSQDWENTWLIMSLLVRANKNGATVVVATHDREIVRRIAHPCAVLQQGRMIVGERACIF